MTPITLRQTSVTVRSCVAGPDRAVRLVAVPKAVMLGLLVAMGGAPAAATELPQVDVVFSSTREGNADIFLLSARDGSVTNLTRHPDGDNWPVWSPDGKRIAFQRRHAGKFDLWVMNADGSAPRRLTDHPDHDYLPAWSADGTTLFFTAWRTDSASGVRRPFLHAMRADGSEQRRLPLASVESSSGAQGSPDGQFLVYSRAGQKDEAQLFIARVDGSDERPLTRSDGGYHGAPSWSPDNRHIAFYCDRGQKGSTIEIIRPDGSGRRTVVASGQHWYPHWSPDGEWLLLTSMAPGSSTEDVGLFAVRSDGSGELVPLAAGPHRESEGSWNPSTAPRH